MIDLRFANCEVNSGYCNWKVGNDWKNAKQIFSLENLTYTPYIFPHYIHILLFHCILSSKEILLIPKITSQNAKNASQFLKKLVCGELNALLHSACLLQN